MSIETGPDEKPSARSDLYSSVFWIVFGGAIVIASWRMDRLTHLGATGYTAPGLVPGLLGMTIVLLGALLARRSLRSLRASPSLDRRAPDRAEPMPGPPAANGDAARRRVAIVLILCLGYALGMVGHGVPFWLATFLFVAVFIGLFEYPMRRERKQIVRGVAMACLYAACTSAVVTTVFEQVFYVRLP